MTADIKRGLTGSRGRGLQRSVSNVSHLSPRARPICGVRAVTGVYRDNLYPQQHIRQQQSPARLATAPPAAVNRSVSNVSNLDRTTRPYQRCDSTITGPQYNVSPPSGICITATRLVSGPRVTRACMCVPPLVRVITPDRAQCPAPAPAQAASAPVASCPRTETGPSEDDLSGARGQGCLATHQ